MPYTSLDYTLYFPVFPSILTHFTSLSLQFDSIVLRLSGDLSMSEQSDLDEEDDEEEL